VTIIFYITTPLHSATMVLTFVNFTHNNDVKAICRRDKYVKTTAINALREILH
jgi:hypothetical protein